MNRDSMCGPEAHRADFFCVIACAGLLLGVATRAAADPGTLRIPHGGGVSLDGRAAEGEWADAARVRVPLELPEADGPAVDVYLKHDGTDLLVGFEHPHRHGNWWPEVLVDARGGGCMTWDDDAWWIHISYQDCASRGRYNDYSTCTPESADFRGFNATNANPEPAMMEAAIPFATLGMSGRSGTVFRLALVLTDTSTTWRLWPVGAQVGIPVTWSTAVLVAGS